MAFCLSPAFIREGWPVQGNFGSKGGAGGDVGGVCGSAVMVIVSMGRFAGMSVNPVLFSSASLTGS